MSDHRDDHQIASTNWITAVVAAVVDVILRDPLNPRPVISALVTELAQRTGLSRLVVRERLLRALLLDTRAEQAYLVAAGMDRDHAVALLAPEHRAAYERYQRQLIERERTARRDSGPGDSTPNFPPRK